jgi:hypothetical protein
MWISRRVVVFPDPEWPVRNTNWPFGTWRERLSRAEPVRG